MAIERNFNLVGILMNKFIQWLFKILRNLTNWLNILRKGEIFLNYCLNRKKRQEVMRF